MVPTLIVKGYILRNLCVLAFASGGYVAHTQSALPPPGVSVASITLDEAIRRAQSVETAYGAAVADSGIAQAQRGIARSTLLPGVVYHNQFIYTQGQTAPHDQTASNGQSTSSVRFIANNAVHEYMSQGVVTETFGGTGLADRKSVV